jgi:hypothetical protein
MAISDMFSFDSIADDDAVRRRDDVVASTQNMVSSMMNTAPPTPAPAPAPPPAPVKTPDYSTANNPNYPKPSFYKPTTGNPDTSADQLNKQELARVINAYGDSTKNAPPAPSPAAPAKQTPSEVSSDPFRHEPEPQQKTEEKPAKTKASLSSVMKGYTSDKDEDEVARRRRKYDILSYAQKPASSGGY